MTSSAETSSDVRSRTTGTNTLELGEVVKRIEANAPLFLAESWDNVGLLVEPSPPHRVSKLLLTNDLTESVLEEAIREQANMLFSYHPPIFAPLKRLTQRSVKERIIVKCIENKIAVYSPHTVYDALEDGVNCWLAEAFASKGIAHSRPISRKLLNSHLCPGTHRLEITLPSQSEAELFQRELDDLCQGGGLMASKSVDGGSVRLSYNMKEETLTKVVRYLKGKDNIPQTEVFQLQKPPHPAAGVGLLVDVKEAVRLEDAVTLVKQHIGLEHIRLSVGNGRDMDSPIKTVACCAGSGSSVLRGTPADLYLTGEMSHHDLLDATSRGISVILCEHSNSERGFLKTLLTRFTDVFADSKMEIVLSGQDKDPVTIV